MSHDQRCIDANRFGDGFDCCCEPDWKAEYSNLKAKHDSLRKLAIAYGLDPDRGSGRTTRRLISAPPDSLYIWCSTHLQDLAVICRAIGGTVTRSSGRKWLWHRQDNSVVELASSSTLTSHGVERYRGHMFSQIIVDHGHPLPPGSGEALTRLIQDCQHRYVNAIRGVGNKASDQ